MKLLLVVFDAALEDIVLSEFEKMGIHHWTKIPKAFGKGKRSDPLLDTHIWPGYHVIYLVAHDNPDKLKPKLRELSEKYKHRGFRVFVVPLEDFI